MSKRSKIPCKSCPFRKDQDATTIPRYCPDKAENLMGTVGEEDGFRQVMSCHLSQADDGLACKGWLVRHGWKNFWVRLFVGQGKMPDPLDVAAACEKRGIELEKDYPTVLDKLRRTAP